MSLTMFLNFMIDYVANKKKRAGEKRESNAKTKKARARGNIFLFVYDYNLHRFRQQKTEM